MHRLEPGMLPGVADFAVNTPALDENARRLIGIEPFEDLAAASHSLASLPGPPKTAKALDALVGRSAEALMALSIRARAIAVSTMSSSRSYEAMEGSILHSLTGFPRR